MEKLIDSKHIDSDKSSFVIDLMKHSSGTHNLIISQNATTENPNQFNTININSINLEETIQALLYFKSLIPEIHKNTPNDSVFKSKKEFSTNELEKIKRLYFKGLEIEEIAYVLNYRTLLIEKTLKNLGFPIVSQKIPKNLRYRKAIKNCKK